MFISRRSSALTALLIRSSHIWIIGYSSKFGTASQSVTTGALSKRKLHLHKSAIIDIYNLGKLAILCTAAKLQSAQLYSDISSAIYFCFSAPLYISLSRPRMHELNPLIPRLQSKLLLAGLPLNDFDESLFCCAFNIKLSSSGLIW